MRCLLLLYLLAWGTSSHAQIQVIGKVIEYNEKGKTIVVPDANVYRLSSSVGTTTDSLGNFKIQYQNILRKLVISSVGY